MARAHVDVKKPKIEALVNVELVESKDDHAGGCSLGLIDW